MGERTARRHKGQRHVYAHDAECEDAGGGFGGLSVHSLRVLTCPIEYAVRHTLSTDGYSRLLQNVIREADGNPAKPAYTCVPPAPGRISGEWCEQPVRAYRQGS